MQVTQPLHADHSAQPALGTTHGSIGITYDNRHSGIATMHADQVAGNTRLVELRPLDELVSSGEVGRRPDLMKVDVEGHEFDVLRGANKAIAEALPAIVLEFNERTARVAGWTLAQAAELLVRWASTRSPSSTRAVHGRSIHSPSISSPTRASNLTSTCSHGRHVAAASPDLAVAGRR